MCKRHEILLFAPRYLPGGSRESSQPEELGIRVETLDKPTLSLMDKISVRVKALFSEIPSYWVMSSDRAIGEAARASAKAFDPDVIVVAHLSMCRFVDYLRIGKPIVFDNHNVESILEAQSAKLEPFSPLGLLRKLESLKVKRYESSIMSRVDLTVAVSDVDRLILQEMSPSARVVTIANGIDVDDAVPDDMPSGKVAMFAGTLQYPPNIEAAKLIAEEILPEIRKSIPDGTVKIVGRNPGPAVLGLAGPGLEIFPNVPDMKPFIDEAGVIIVPLRSGSGTRLKILEAMAKSKCIVSTSKGAEGLEITDGVDILIRDDMKEFAAVVVGILNNPEEARRIGRNARITVAEKYGNERLSIELEKYLFDMVNAGKSTGQPV